MFGRKKTAPAAFDRTGKTPVVRASICTGEKVAGYRDGSTGHFTEVMLIRDEGDMEDFLRTYGFSRDEVKYEW